MRKPYRIPPETKIVEITVHEALQIRPHALLLNTMATTGIKTTYTISRYAFLKMEKCYFTNIW